MKARNTKTGEIVEDFNYSHEYGTASYIDSNGLLRFAMPHDGEWEIIKPKFDTNDFQQGVILVEESKWSIFRRETTKDILCSLLQDGRYSGDGDNRGFVSQAIGIADDLIEELRKSNAQ